jgi:HSP20 family protein
MDARAIWNPWHELRRLQQQMEHVVGDVSPVWRWPLGGEYPPVNVTRDDTGITLEALCPGVEAGALDVSVVGDAVTIRGERKPDPGVPEDHYHRRERPLGAFTRTVGFGERLDPERAKATYTNGILTLRLARAPDATPKRITVQN